MSVAEQDIAVQLLTPNLSPTTNALFQHHHLERTEDIIQKFCPKYSIRCIPIHMTKRHVSDTWRYSTLRKCSHTKTLNTYSTTEKYGYTIQKHQAKFMSVPLDTPHKQLQSRHELFLLMKSAGGKKKILYLYGNSHTISGEHQIISSINRNFMSERGLQRMSSLFTDGKRS